MKNHHINRRTLVQGVAWSAPVVIASAAIPAYAASQMCGYALSFTAQDPNPQNPRVFAASGGSQGMNVRFRSSDRAGTTHAQDIRGVIRNFNMSTGGSGINGAVNNNVDRVFNNFSPPSARGALVLNQRATNLNQGYSPAQTVHLDFLDSSGNTVKVTDLKITIFDISSAVTTNPRSTYWDAVYFNQAPNRIVAATAEDAGTGAGTQSSPFHRANGHFPTITGRFISDDFYWDSVPASGLDLTYT